MKYEIVFRHNEYDREGRFVGTLQKWDEYVATWGGTYTIISKCPIEG